MSSRESPLTAFVALMCASLACACGSHPIGPCIADPPYVLTLRPGTDSMRVGAEQTVHALVTACPNEDVRLAWTTLDTVVVEVLSPTDTSAIVRGKAVGSAQVFANIVAHPQIVASVRIEVTH